jgi:hypothetical protein
MRIGLNETRCLQQDLIPKWLVIMLNNSKYEPKDDKFIDITKYCMKSNTEIKLYWLYHKYIGRKEILDNDNLCVGVYLVRYLDNVKEKLASLTNGSVELIPSNFTKQLIRSFFKSENDGIEMNSKYLKVTLLCPFSSKRLQIPGRSTNCTGHIQCFDIASFIQLQIHNDKWQCPICKNKAPYSTLRVDQYFSNIIKTTKDTTREIFLRENGTWLQNTVHIDDKENVNTTETMEIDNNNSQVNSFLYKSTVFSDSIQTELDSNNNSIILID